MPIRFLFFTLYILISLPVFAGELRQEILEILPGEFRSLTSQNTLASVKELLKDQIVRTNESSLYVKSSQPGIRECVFNFANGKLTNYSVVFTPEQGLLNGRLYSFSQEPSALVRQGDKRIQIILSKEGVELEFVANSQKALRAVYVDLD